MGATREVLSEMDVFKLSEQYGFKVVVLYELEENGWIQFNPQTRLSSGLHWERGFLVVKDLLLKDA